MLAVFIEKGIYNQFQDDDNYDHPLQLIAGNGH